MSCFVNGVHAFINGILLLGDLKLCGGARITSCDGHDILIVPGTGGITRIGDAGNPIFIAAVNDNFFVSGDVEIAGQSFLRGQVTVNDNIFFGNNFAFVFGIGVDAAFEYDSGADQFLLGLNAVTGHQFVICNNAFRARDFDHGNQPNPTRYIQSATDPDVDNTEWISSAHNQTDKISGIGKGGHVTNHVAPVDVADGAFFEIPDATAGFGTLIVGDSEEFTQWYWASDGSVTLVNNTANVVNTDTAARFCIFPNGTTVTVRNRLGSAKKVLFDYHYTTP